MNLKYYKQVGDHFEKRTLIDSELIRLLLMVIAGFLLGAIVSAACFAAKVRYTPESMPAHYQSITPNPRTGTFFWPGDVAHGPGARGSRQWLSSNPNWVDPWIRPAGCNGVSGERMSIERFLTVPTGQHIHVWKQRINDAPVNQRDTTRIKYRWHFPLGTKVEEQLYYDGKMFADRARTKVSMEDGAAWEVSRDEVLFAPAGFQAVTRDCVDCHRDAGRNAKVLPGDFPGREWYGDLRGDDNVFSYRPIRPTGEIPDQFKSFVKLVSSPSLVQS